MGTDEPSGAPAALELVRVEVPLVHPHRSSTDSQLTRESILVGWQDADGTTGWAECPTLAGSGYVTETTESAWQALVTTLGASVLAGSLPPATGTTPTPAAVAALRDAELDARLRRVGRSTSSWLSERTGRDAAPTLRWCAVLADVSLAPAQLAARAAAAVGLGAAMVKVKVVDAPGCREVVRALREVIDVGIAADANGSLSPSDAVGLDDLGLVYLEQPLAPTATPADWAALCEDMATPVALDESVGSVADAAAAIDAAAVDVVSVKPARVGGIAAAAGLVALCASREVDCFVGGMFELGIGRAGALAVASLAGSGLPTDLGPSANYVADDVCEPVVLDDAGRIVVPAGLGCGRRPDPGEVDRWVVDRMLLTSPSATPPHGRPSE